MEEGERPMFARALSRGQWVALDIAAAITYALLLPPVSRHSSGVEFLAAAMIALPVAARRRWPLSAFFVSLTCSLVCAWAGVLREPFLAAALALYMVAATGSRGRREPTLVIGVISLVVLLIAGTSGAPRAGATVGVLLTGCAALGVAWTVGRAVRERRIYAARSAEQLAREAVTSERLRIAREMHDVVSHTLSVIGVKAGVAAHVAETRPEEVVDALRVIETTSREALLEMRRLLGILRAETSAPMPTPTSTPTAISSTSTATTMPRPHPTTIRGVGPTGDQGTAGVPHTGHSAGRPEHPPPDADIDLGAVELRPLPGVEALPALAERAQMAGVHVRMELSGLDFLPHDVSPPGGVTHPKGTGSTERAFLPESADLPEGVGVSEGVGLPESVGLTVYRIVQEAVTNVIKHAAPADCLVMVSRDADEVRIEVRDDGPGAQALPSPPGSPGHGLAGMRERVMMYGGTLTAGPRPEGGFVVSARLPLGGEGTVEDA
jgi:signal transduction histidine kinase